LVSAGEKSEAGQKELIPGVLSCRNGARIHLAIASSNLDFGRLMHAMGSCLGICRIETFASMLFMPLFVGGFLGVVV